MSKKNIHKYKLALWISLACLTIFRFWFNGRILLTGDEAYHWEWARHLAWGYYDHPPLVAFMIRLFTEIFGNTLLAVRAGALIFSVLSVIIVYLLAKDISGREETGLLAGLLVLIIPIYTVGALITTTDTPNAFFWLLSVYCFYKALFSDKRSWWYIGGASLGLAFLSKFFAFFIPLGLLAFLLISPTQRHWLKKKEPYLAILLAFAIFSPFIYWNATNEWATFGFNLAKRHKAPQLSFKYLGEYLGGQSLVLFPTFLILYIYGLYKSAHKGLIEKNDNYLFLFCTSAPLWLAFLFISTYQRVGVHWPIATYFSGLVIIALLFQGAPNWYRKLFKVGIWGSAIMILVVYAFAFTLSLTPKVIPWDWAYPGRPEKINAKKLREFYGWEEVGQRISQSYKEMSSQGPTFIFTGSYALSSQLSFYTPGNIFVNMLGTGSVHGRNYDFWQDLDKLKGQNALQVSKDGKHPEDYHHLFERVEAEKPLKIYIEGELIRTFPIFRCYNYLGNG